MGGGSGWHSLMHDDPGAETPPISLGILRRVARYGRPYFWRILAMLACVLVVTGVGLIPPLLMRDLIDNAIGKGDATRLNWLALGMVAVPVVNGLIGVFQRYLGATVGEGVICDLRQQVFRHLQSMSLRFFTHTRTGELMSRLNNDVVGSQQAITGTAVTLISNVVALIATLMVMISLDWRLTLVSILVLPLFILPARRVARVLREIVREQMNLNARMNALANETLNVSGALLVKLFGRANTEAQRYGERARSVRDIGIRQSVIGRWFFLGLSLISAVGTALVFWLGGHLALSGEFTIGTIVAFGAYLGQLYGPVSALTNARVELATALVSFERVFEVLDLPREIDELQGAVHLRDLRGEVSLDDVNFTYGEAGAVAPALLKEVRRWRQAEVVGTLTGEMANERTRDDGNGRQARRQRLAVRNVSFTVRPGQLAALVGPSGAGKTTITYLIPRLYDPTAGRILIDGVDLRQIALDSLAETIGMVTQETFLFHDSIRANLLYARAGATQEQLEAACRVANIHDFIAGLPDGYDTIVGERGYRLSGGEKQRLAIARVVLKDPRILILDEATSHLDSRSEALIQDALERVMRGRTSIVIAHRLSTVLRADIILVMDGGRLVESGTHAELLDQGGLYAHLYETQFRHLKGSAILPDRRPTEVGDRR